MKFGLFERVAAAFRREPPMHPVERQMAKRWIKQRLLVVFPHLRNNPRALEQAYRELSLEVQHGEEEGEAEAVFEMTFPEER